MRLVSSAGAFGQQRGKRTLPAIFRTNAAFSQGHRCNKRKYVSSWNRSGPALLETKEEFASPRTTRTTETSIDHHGEFCVS
jgi:hypothetical protein